MIENPEKEQNGMMRQAHDDMEENELQNNEG